MTSPIAEEVARIEKCLTAACDKVVSLAVLPQTESACRSAIHGLDKRGKQDVADMVEHVFHLEQAAVYRRPLPGAAGGAGDDGVSRYGDVASELDLERRLTHAYFELLAALTADADAKAVLESLAAVPSGSRAFTGTVTSVAKLVHRRAFEPRQLSLSAAAVESRVRMATAERDVALLKDELARKRKVQGKEAGTAQARIDAVKAELAELYGGANDQYNRVQADMRVHVDELTGKHSGSAVELREVLAKLTAEHAAVAKASAEAEAALRKRVQRAEMDAETAVREFDSEVAAKQAEIDALRVAITEDAPAVKEFTDYYRVVREAFGCGLSVAIFGMHRAEAARLQHRCCSRIAHGK